MREDQSVKSDDGVGASHGNCSGNQDRKSFVEGLISRYSVCVGRAS